MNSKQLDYDNIIYKSLKILAQGLYPYIEAKMREKYSDNWLETAKCVLKNQQGLKKCNLDETLRKDVSLQLKLIYKLWDSIFENHLSQPIKYKVRLSKSKVKKLLDIRNEVAHLSSFSKDKTCKSVDCIIQLLKAIDAPEAEDVENEKQEVLQLLSKSAQITKSKSKKSLFVEIHLI
ncbi:MAG: Swt1 family HEPN domain-containing protein [Microcoleaceae cyanobacterium MO_207.B10]|nr:Swt1 family HEPN domain-containing protein [Microcoleaceae cyanobacterium MO_207.B10]